MLPGEPLFLEDLGQPPPRLAGVAVAAQAGPVSLVQGRSDFPEHQENVFEEFIANPGRARASRLDLRLRRQPVPKSLFKPGSRPLPGDPARPAGLVPRDGLVLEDGGSRRVLPRPGGEGVEADLGPVGSGPP